MYNLLFNNCTSRRKRKALVLCVALILNSISLSLAQQTSPDVMAKETEQKMTDRERFAMITSLIGYVPALGMPRDKRIPEGTTMSAGYTPGVPRLGVPNIQSSDASMGVTNPGYRPDDKGATALPASILVGASFNPELAYQGGVVIGKEARARGFNVMLAGGINLTRDPRNGRNFEYYSEDPLVSALLAAGAVNGIQSQKVISTLKHYTLNCNETNRHWLDAVIDPAAHRESDLLAFQMAIEKSNPGSIMSGYNKVNGEYAGGNDYQLNKLLKDTWGYKGWVMSDWGAVPSWTFALKGLDQESGIQVDVHTWGAEAFTDSLQNAYKAGNFTKERLSNMVQRILRSVYAVGVDKWEGTPTVDMSKHNETALATARQGIVLLKNDAALPLSVNEPVKIAVIGGYAHLGVPTGTGSGAVLPVGGYAASINVGGPGLMGNARSLYLLPSSPLAELKKLMPNATVEFDPGYMIAESKLLAKRSDIVIVFGIRVEGEGSDLADISLPWGQDALISEVASTNPNTIVVLETGNASSMPWRGKVKAILQAWYPGQAGGTAIAEILTGKVNPSGRLPLTFPESLEQTPRPELSGLGTPWGTPTTIVYNEGADAGYRWYAKKNIKPMYAFGYGLSYTSFSYSDLKVQGGKTVTASFTVTNTGNRAGADVPQLYLTNAAGENNMRLLGFERTELAPGESKQVTLTADPRLLAHFDWEKQKWQIKAGIYEIALGKSAVELQLHSSVKLAAQLFGK
ncbi:beta-glucosidase [Agriterribacter sp.]|uniref:beta-glucosidase n=1 Tax=Agriterribacter sp. TaxID=2821509 RepID=UPI002C2DBE07|nr:beta-glucosidase [Agriterribacter sp.]HRP57468.1 beta-glucosidase [Agriterribacter sp.]